MDSREVVENASGALRNICLVGTAFVPKNHRLAWSLIMTRVLEENRLIAAKEGALAVTVDALRKHIGVKDFVDNTSAVILFIALTGEDNKKAAKKAMTEFKDQLKKNYAQVPTVSNLLTFLDL